MLAPGVVAQNGQASAFHVSCDSRVRSVRLYPGSSSQAHCLTLSGAASHQPADTARKMLRSPRYTDTCPARSQDVLLLGVIVCHDREAEGEILDQLGWRSDVEYGRSINGRQADVRRGNTLQGLRLGKKTRDFHVGRHTAARGVIRQPRLISWPIAATHQQQFRLHSLLVQAREHIDQDLQVPQSVERPQVRQRHHSRLSRQNAACRPAGYPRG